MLGNEGIEHGERFRHAVRWKDRRLEEQGVGMVGLASENDVKEPESFVVSALRSLDPGLKDRSPGVLAGLLCLLEEGPQGLGQGGIVSVKVQTSD